MAIDHKKELYDLIETVIRETGSDIHISGERPPSVRIDDNLVSLVKHPIPKAEDMIGFLNVLIPKEKVDAFLKTQEADFSYDYEGKARLRGNASMHQGLMSIALRLIPEIHTIEELHLPPILHEFARKKQGFFLVVGPVGQGKTTTMAAMIDQINKERAEHIVTIEDPIEYQFKAERSIIDQREVGIDTESFESALESVFRQDVDVIMIGEMRSKETIATAVTAAETGHLVLSTLHTNNASQTIDRIVDSFASIGQDQIRLQLAGSLLGIFSQRLIPRIAGGLVPAYELLINNNAVSNLIREKRTHEIDVVIETGYEQGMIDMNRSLAGLVQQGEISVEQAMSNSLNPKGLERLF